MCAMCNVINCSFTYTVNVVFQVSRNEIKTKTETTRPTNQPTRMWIVWLLDGNKIMRNIRTSYPYRLRSSQRLNGWRFVLRMRLDTCIWNVCSICASIERILLHGCFVFIFSQNGPIRRNGNCESSMTLITFHSTYLPNVGNKQRKNYHYYNLIIINDVCSNLFNKSLCIGLHKIAIKIIKCVFFIEPMTNERFHNSLGRFVVCFFFLFLWQIF